MFKSVILAVLLLLLSSSVSNSAAASMSFDALEGATPGDQYRQLSLMLLIASGIEPRFVDMMAPLGEPGPEDMQLKLDDYVTPLVRIVDQQTMLANANALIRFTRENQQEIQQRMRDLAADHPILISMLDVNELTADAIIIRNSIADSLEYSEQLNAEDAEAIIQRFREQTIFLRNMMEYNQFQVELARITDQAITDLGGRLDAYQRMFNEEVDPDLVNRRVMSAEIMNQQVDDRYQEQANQRNAELLMMLILMESQVH